MHHNLSTVQTFICLTLTRQNCFPPSLLATSLPILQEAFANIGTSVLTMVNMLAGGVDLTIFNGARPHAALHACPGNACAGFMKRQPSAFCK